MTAGSNYIQNPDIFNIHKYFVYFNFPLLVIQDHATVDFFNMLIAANSFLAFYIIVLVLWSASLFHSAKQGSLKDGTKAIVALLSFIMVLFLTIGQLPMLLLNLQGYLCNEDLN